MTSFLKLFRQMFLLIGVGSLATSCAGAIPRVDPPQSAVNVPQRTAAMGPRREAPRMAHGPSRQLENAIAALGRSFNGEVGIAVRDIEQGWTVSWNGDRYFPQQSVSKLWVALTMLDAVDRGRLRLEQSVRVTRDDFVVFHQPMRERIGANGYETTLNFLFQQAMTRSDNLANDKILWLAGGPEAVRDFFRRHRLDGLRFGPGERLLQSGIAGVDWHQGLAQGRRFYTARANVPASVRRRSMDNYLADPVDGATPNGMVDALARLERGELLSARSTRAVLSAMENSRTGPQRLRGAVPQGWRFGHKTGTGQNFQGRVAGYNDVGIVTSPDGRSYAVAVLIGSTRVGIPQRQQLMQAVMGQTVTHHLRRRSEMFAARGGR